jgi:NAD(P)-dependent dehydrogenase (short-subunit alcohol dehydrogenase family)
MALFNNESPEQWSDLYSINAFSIFFVTTAFLGLLAKGSEDKKNHTSCVINVTSVSGIGESKSTSASFALTRFDDT